MANLTIDRPDTTHNAAGRRILVLSFVLWVIMTGRPALGQPPAANYDEAKVGLYSLPDPLMRPDGVRVATRQEWELRQRPHIVALFEEYVYGRVPEPPRPIKPVFSVRSEDRGALGGKAVRREVAIRFNDDPAGPVINLLLYLPKDTPAGQRVPVFLGLNFQGNHAVSTDPGISLSTQWLPNNDQGVVDHRASEKSRGSEASRWPVERILARGFGLATAYYGDIDPDYDDGFTNGVQPLFYKPGQTRPAPDEWGSIAAWAWGLSRMLDYLETAPEVDASRVAVMGHSRLGKTALWAGARDPRFSIVISNNSGAGGAALSRRIFGETVADLNRSFPHWFCGNFKFFSDREGLLPVDQHELIALIAPRPVLISSAAEDQWADPKGEFLTALAADPIYRLLGTDGLAIKRWPEPVENSLVKTTIGYRIRPGKHDVTTSDWDAYMDFAAHHWRLVRKGDTAMFSEAEAYERFMGRWSRRLAPSFLKFAGLKDGDRVLDVGAGTGALAEAILQEASGSRVVGIDPSPAYVAHARARAGGGHATFEEGDVQRLRFPVGSFDAALALLVVNFIPDRAAAVREMARVTRPGGVVAAAVWDYGKGMEMLRAFWDEAVAFDPASEPRDERHMPACRPGELGSLWKAQGLLDVREEPLVIPLAYSSFEDFWSPFRERQGPAGAHVASLSEGSRRDLERRLRRRLLGEGGDRQIKLSARAWAVRGVVPAR
jgi:SAM-dependent methyltransferase